MTDAMDGRRGPALREALGYVSAWRDRRVVIKVGGSSTTEEGQGTLIEDVAALHGAGVHPILVHGGGPEITDALKLRGVTPRFIDGLRVTDRETIQAVEMVLAGSINKSVVADIQRAGGKAVGISGKDGNLCIARKLRRTKKDPDSNIERIIVLFTPFVVGCSILR